MGFRTDLERSVLAGSQRGDYPFDLMIHGAARRFGMILV
jgi:hypothetical protein